MGGDPNLAGHRLARSLLRLLVLPQIGQGRGEPGARQSDIMSAPALVLGVQNSGPLFDQVFEL